MGRGPQAMTRYLLPGLLLLALAGCPAPPTEQAAIPGARATAPALAAPAATPGETCPDPVPGAATAATAPAAAATARSATTTTTPATGVGAATATPATPAPAAATRLPRLVDLGRGTCIPCKMMAPILEQLKTEYAGRVTIEVIDITDNAAAARQYGIRTIPTQIFFDAAGKEVSRHEGFLPKDEIVRIFQQQGIR